VVAFTSEMSDALIRDAYFLQRIDGKEPATDSAAAGTALATGQKTDAGNISWAMGDPENGALETIAEQFGSQGLSIGIASTVPFSHATPAAFISHNVSRNNYNEIGSEIVNDAIADVIIGGGNPNTYGSFRYLSEEDYNAVIAGETPYTTFVEWTEGVDGGTAVLEAAEDLDVNAGEKLFGYFGGEGGNLDFHEVSDTPGSPNVERGAIENPTLADMTTATLTALNPDPDGFFAMFEQGDIDWSNHGNDFENMIGGMWDLEEAVLAAEAFVDQEGDDLTWENTLMIVTSDHGNSYMRNEEVLGAGDLPLQVEADEDSGYGGSWVYPDGEISYGTTNHTNELVTLWARGEESELFEAIAGEWYPGTAIVDNTQIYEVMHEAVASGVEHVILFVGDGMELGHEIAASRYLYGEDEGLSWQDWGELEDGWAGYGTTWDVNTYNKYASLHDRPEYDPEDYDPTLGYDPALGGAEPGFPRGSILDGTPEGEDIVGPDDSDDMIRAHDGDDTVAGGLGSDWIDGEDGDDVLRGDANLRSPGHSEGGDDVIFGGAGSDRIGGKMGDDALYGGEGDDAIWGDDGDDLIRGGLGNDMLVGDDFSGGEGSDTFVLAAGEGTDTIVDFEVGVDAIGLAGGLEFADLTLSGNAIMMGEETLATLGAIDATTLMEDSFVSI